MKIGIIGCGTVSGAYFEGARKTDILEIKACTDLRMEAAHAQAEKYNCDACTDDDVFAGFRGFIEGEHHLKYVVCQRAVCTVCASRTDRRYHINDPNHPGIVRERDFLFFPIAARRTDINGTPKSKHTQHLSLIHI